MYRLGSEGLGYKGIGRAVGTISLLIALMNLSSSACKTFRIPYLLSKKYK